MAFVLLLLISLSVIVQTEARTAAAGTTLNEARSNAILGLAIAAGELQKHAGADQRVTAPATTVYPEKDVTRGTGDLYDDPSFGYRSFAATSTARSYFGANGGRIATYTTPSERENWDEQVRDWWNDDGYQPHWTAVFDSSLRVDRATNPNAAPTPRPRQSYEDDPDTTYGEFKRDQLPVWLVSGNEGLDFDPATATGYPEDYLTPLNIADLPDPSSDPESETVWVVGEGSVGTPADSADGLDGRVKVKRVKLDKADDQTAGHYAYWVGDESVKANFSVQSEDPDGVDAETYRNYLQVPQRVGWERMEGFAGLSLDPYDPVFEKVLTHNQIPLIDPDSDDLPEALANNFHGITSYSRSLLTDTALGGLKKNLTRYLESGQGLSGSDPIPDRDLYDPDDPRFAAWGGSNEAFPRQNITDGIPTWGQVRAWYQNTGDDGEVDPNTENKPVVTYINLHAGVSYDPGTQRLHWHWVPAITLWNPLDVGLSSATYDLELQVGPQFWQFYLAHHNAPLEVLQLDAGAEWANRPVGPPDGDGNPTNVWSFKSNVPNPSPVGGADPEIWPKQDPDRNVGGEGPYPISTTFAEGTSDAYGNFFYNLRRVNELTDNDIHDPFITNDPTNPDEGQDNEDDGIGPKGWPGARWDPQRLNNATADEIVPIRFSINASFGPGESKIFTIPTTTERNPHTDTAPVPLEPGIDVEFPASMHFPVFEVINGPASADGLRWVGSFLAQRKLDPAVELSLNGETLQRINEFGSNSAFQRTMGHGLYNLSNDNDNDGDGVSDKSESRLNFVSAWRQVSALNDFEDNARPQDTGHVASSIIPIGEHFLTPLTAQGNGTKGDFHANIPGFSRFNLNATELNLHPLLDRIRDQFGTNNRNFAGDVEGLGSLFYINSTPKHRNTPKWDNDQAEGDNGFSLITFQQSGGDYEGLFELPVRVARRAESKILSLGQFQQVNLSPYSWQPAFPIGNSWAGVYNDREAIAGIHSREPGVGASWFNGNARLPQVIPNNTAFTLTGKNQWGKDLDPVEVPANAMIDLSYLLNEALWDRYFLSGIDGSPNLSEPLPNSRLRYTDDAAAASDAELEGFDTAAAFLTNHGALNVNSTSVEAWKALLTAFRDLSLGDNPSETVPVSRTLDPIGDSIRFAFDEDLATDILAGDIGATSNNKDYSKLLNGFRYLTDGMIQTLAERIVDEVRLRGPFFSTADFVNRRLVAPHGSNQEGSAWFEARTDGWTPPNRAISGNKKNNYLDFINTDYDPFVGLQGLTGALQRALDLSGINGGVNDPRFGRDGTGSGDSNDRALTVRIKNAGTATDPGNFENDYTSDGIGGSSNTQEHHSHDPGLRSHLDSEHYAGAPIGEAGLLFQGTPGLMTQGDLLAMIGPALTARGDTFLIRTYGDSINPVTGRVDSKVWLETVVQRVAEPVTAADPNDNEDRWRPVDRFGRRFEIVSMRWLGENDI